MTHTMEDLEETTKSNRCIVLSMFTILHSQWRMAAGVCSGVLRLSGFRNVTFTRPGYGYFMKICCNVVAYFTLLLVKLLVKFYVKTIYLLLLTFYIGSSKTWCTLILFSSSNTKIVLIVRQNCRDRLDTIMQCYLVRGKYISRTCRRAGTYFCLHGVFIKTVTLLYKLCLKFLVTTKICRWL